METKTKLINDIKFEIAQPYAAGHVCSEAEAKALNQVRSENIGNNMRAAVKKALEDGKTEAEIVAIVAEYDGKYEFNLASVRAAGAAKLDPIEKEARKLARELIVADLAKKGRKISQVPDGLTKEEWDEKVETKIDEVAAHEAVIAEATKIVKARSKRADTLAAALGDVTA